MEKPFFFFQKREKKAKDIYCSFMQMHSCVFYLLFYKSDNQTTAINRWRWTTMCLFINIMVLVMWLAITCHPYHSYQRSTFASINFEYILIDSAILVYPEISMVYEFHDNSKKNNNKSKYLEFTWTNCNYNLLSVALLRYIPINNYLFNRLISR